MPLAERRRGREWEVHLGAADSKCELPQSRFCRQAPITAIVEILIEPIVVKLRELRWYHGFIPVLSVERAGFLFLKGRERKHDYF